MNPDAARVRAAVEPFVRILSALEEAKAAGRINLEDDYAWVVIPYVGGGKLQWTIGDLKRLRSLADRLGGRDDHND